MGAPSFVPETMQALDLFRSFLTHPQGLAIVVDEFGGTEGIITLSDIIEEIISDAAPLGDADLYIEPLDDGRFLVSGNARLDDLSEHLGFELEADGIDTIGGLDFQPARLSAAVGNATRNAAPRGHGPAHRPKTDRGNSSRKNRLPRSRGGRRRSDRAMIYGFAILVLWTISFFFAGIEAGLALGRSGPAASPGETGQARRAASRSPHETTGAPARHRFAGHEFRGHPRAASPDQAARRRISALPVLSARS